MTITQELINIIEALEGHVITELPLGPQECAALALQLAGITQSVEAMEQVAVTQEAIDAWRRLAAEPRERMQ